MLGLFWMILISLSFVFQCILFLIISIFLFVLRLVSLDKTNNCNIQNLAWCDSYIDARECSPNKGSVNNNFMTWEHLFMDIFNYPNMEGIKQITYVTLATICASVNMRQIGTTKYLVKQIQKLIFATRMFLLASFAIISLMKLSMCWGCFGESMTPYFLTGSVDS